MMQSKIREVNESNNTLNIMKNDDWHRRIYANNIRADDERHDDNKSIEQYFICSSIIEKLIIDVF